VLPIETRLKDETIDAFRSFPDEWTTFPLDLADAAGMGDVLARISEVKRVPLALARALGLEGVADSPRPSGCAAPTSSPTFPRGATRSSTFRIRCCSRGCHPRHAGTERDRRGARAHAQASAVRPRHPVRARG
jgi:hypothetical protein